MYGEDFSFDYNHNKTVWVVFSRWQVEVKTSVKLCGAMLKWVDNIEHFG